MRKISTLTVLALACAMQICRAQPNLVRTPPEQALTRMRPMLTNNIARPLRYFPDGTDFVITNGAEYFNRPLYCMNSAFRIDAGDKPEFSLYLPGRGGNLRLGIKTAAGVKWLDDADEIISRYRPGSMIYEIRDSLLGDGELDVSVLPYDFTQGFVFRVETGGTGTPVEFFWAFGGMDLKKGARGGDLGCEREPVGKFFQFTPEQCRGNEFVINGQSFIVQRHRKPMEMPDSLSSIASWAQAPALYAEADAKLWDNPAELLASRGSTNPLPVAVGRAALAREGPFYFDLHMNWFSPGFGPGSLPIACQAAEDHRRKVAEQVVVETPDAFINAAVPALNIAADAIWDRQQQGFMHGAVAWRTRLPGWRGPYAGDALGWHDRTAAHFAGYAREQNTNPVPETIPPADERFNLARNEAALHSNGDLTGRPHYDMNLVAVDAFFRHLLWTGDTNYARAMWPVIERHLAWEHRLFRREFGDDKLPLYEAYAAIWASDDLNYNGGGTAHASAYNYWQNEMAARVAKILGEDAAPYEREADLIMRGMQKYLWLPDEGNFAEFKDYLGLQLAHPNAGLWTFYHVIDSEVPSPEQAWRMSRWVDTHIAHIPVTGKNVPDENLSMLPETSWMPYEWSLNNVVMAENAHTALGFWQANRPDTAFALFKGELITSMFIGLCPGNVGAMTTYDAARGEAQRDFGDAIGINARALVEGLFGVRPDALAGELKVVPGFPAEWGHAAIRHPDFNIEFRRDGLTETYSIGLKFPGPMALRLQIPALRDGVAGVTVNGAEAKWERVPGLFGVPRIEITSPAAGKFLVVVNWKGEVPAENVPPEKPSAAPQAAPAFDWHEELPAGTNFETVNLAPFFNDRVTQIFRNEYRSPRSPFCSLATPKQGIGGWCEPDAGFDVDDSGLRAAAAAGGGRIVLPDGVPFETSTNAGAKNIIFASQWDNYPREASVPLSGRSRHAFLLMAGSTGAMQSRFDNGEIVVTYADCSIARLALNNPANWWPIDQDYFMDDYAFQRPEPLPPRVDLQTGRVRLLDAETFKGRGGKIPGGAATVLEMPLDGGKELKSITVRALANEVVIGLMSVTLER
jgi:hypothetical protein